MWFYFDLPLNITLRNINKIDDSYANSLNSKKVASIAKLSMECYI